MESPLPSPPYPAHSRALPGQRPGPRAQRLRLVLAWLTAPRPAPDQRKGWGTDPGLPTTHFVENLSGGVRGDDSSVETDIPQARASECVSGHSLQLRDRFCPFLLKLYVF